MPITPLHRWTAVRSFSVVLLAGVLLVSACRPASDSAHRPSTLQTLQTLQTPQTPARTPSSSTATMPRPAPTSRTAAPAVRRNPFTGGPYSPHPVVIVKIEDTAAGRPQLGIDKADLVYIEQVEGGLTRLLAVYNTVLPTVEPVRSTRANDPELALQFGPVDYVASGGSPPELAPLRRSSLRTTLNDSGGPGFARDPDRPVPNNLTADLATVARALKGPKAKDVGLVWAGAVPASATKDGHRVQTRVGNTSVTFEWNAARHRYLRLIDGVVQRTATGAIISTPNVVVQFCRSTVYRKDRDVNGNPAQWTHTVGRGRVAVFRNGRRIDGTWTRRSVPDGTALRDAQGAPIPLSPGGAWFALTADGTPLG